MVPDDSPDKARLFDAVGSSLMTRYELLREHIDLENAIQNMENSLLITPADQLDDPLKLIWLGSALVQYAKINADAVNAEWIRTLAQTAFRVWSYITLRESDPDTLGKLAVICKCRFYMTNDKADLKEAILLRSKAARSPLSSPTERLSDNVAWAEYAQSCDDSSVSLLDAYASAFDALPQVAWLGFSMNSGYQALLDAL